MEEAENEIKERKSNLKKICTSWIKDNYDKVFIVILILAFIIRFWIFLKTMNQPLWWDTASYLATAKQWGLGLNVNSVWYFRRGFLWALIPAIFFKLGLGETGIRFATVLFSTGIVAVSYFLIRDMFSKKIALFTSLIMTFSWVYLFFAGRPMTSTPASFFILLSLFFFWKGYVQKKGNKFIYLFGLFFALSVLTRMQYLMFAPVFAIYVFTKEKFKLFKNKHLWIAVIIFSLTFLPHAILYSQHFGNFLLDMLTYYVRIPGLTQPGSISPIAKADIHLFKFITDLPYALSKPIFALFFIGLFCYFIDMFLGIDKIFKNPEVQKKIFIFFWLLIPLLVLGYMSPYPQQRYLMPLYPFLFAIAVIPLFKVGDLFKSKSKAKDIIIFALVLLLVTYPTFSLVQNSQSNLAWANSLIDNKINSYGEVMQAGIWMKENSETGDIVISESYPQTAYYSERSTFAFSGKGNPELHVEQNEEEFNEFIKLNKPKYMMISIFQVHPEWVYTYPEKHQELLVPVQVYSQGEQPVLVIYTFNYSLEEVSLV